MKLESVNKSNIPGKKYTATFCLCPAKESCCEKVQKKVVHFGQAGSTTYVEGANEQTREAYIARHRVNEDFTDPLTAGALSRWLLWGESKFIDENIKAFKKKFNV